MSAAQLQELEALRAKVARYEAPGGWTELKWRDCRRATDQGEFRQPMRASITDKDGQWKQL